MSLPKWIRDTFDVVRDLATAVDVFGHDYDLPVTDAGAERLTELEAEVDHLEPRVFDARDENAIALLKVDPDKFFAITNLCLPKPERDKAIADALKAARDEDAAWDANELHDRAHSEPVSFRERVCYQPFCNSCGNAVAGPCPTRSRALQSVAEKGNRCRGCGSPLAADLSPTAGVQRAASPEGVSDETPDTPPPRGAPTRHARISPNTSRHSSKS